MPGVFIDSPGIMNNLCARFGCHISSNNRDKQGAVRPPPLQALSVSNHPGEIGLKGPGQH